MSLAELYIGLMSGTSLDGVDGVLADFSEGQLRVLQHASRPLGDALKAELLALNQPGDNELHRAALAANALARVYAAVVNDLLRSSGIPAQTVKAVGAHGQTVRHRPGEFDGDAVSGVAAVGYTLQLNNPALLAELTGVDVVADFRTRDVAAGGQGAPLVPAFHQALFGRRDETVAVLNIGGIANLSLLRGDGSVLGFDTGPGNALMDGWCLAHTGCAFDAGGAWAASGKVLPGLLQSLLGEAFLAKPAPKSTGRDLFHSRWLAHHLAAWPTAAPADVQATLAEYTAVACAMAISSYQNESNNALDVIVCGGGALNTHLMQRLQSQLPGCQVGVSTRWGLPPLEVEATAFAWLARRTVRRETGSLQSVTGARGARVLGAIYPA